MVEVNRRLYMEEGTGVRLAVFEKVAGLVRLVVHRGCSA
jgi:hypothetical protein